MGRSHDERDEISAQKLLERVSLFLSNSVVEMRTTIKGESIV